MQEDLSTNRTKLERHYVNFIEARPKKIVDPGRPLIDKGKKRCPSCHRKSYRQKTYEEHIRKCKRQCTVWERCPTQFYKKHKKELNDQFDKETRNWEQRREEWVKSTIEERLAIKQQKKKKKEEAKQLAIEQRNKQKMKEIKPCNIKFEDWCKNNGIEMSTPSGILALNETLDYLQDYVDDQTGQQNQQRGHVAPSSSSVLQSMRVLLEEGGKKRAQTMEYDELTQNRKKREDVAPVVCHQDMSFEGIKRALELKHSKEFYNVLSNNQNPLELNEQLLSDRMDLLRILLVDVGRLKRKLGQYEEKLEVELQQCRYVQEKRRKNNQCSTDCNLINVKKESDNEDKNPTIWL